MFPSISQTMIDLPMLLSRLLGDNTLRDAAFALGVFCFCFLFLWGLKIIVVSRLMAYARRTSRKVDDVLVGLISSIGMLFYVAISVSAAAQFLVLPPTLDWFIRLIFLVAVTVETVKILERFIGFLLRHKFLKIAGRDDDNIVQLMQILVSVILWTVAVLLVLSNMGVEITSLVASLGIGGIAVALAVQSILGDVFNSFSIYLDRPFEVGDFIVIDPHMGTVKRIGLKTTRIQALSGEELVIPNSQLTSARIQNFKQLQRRRVLFEFGVTYDTSSEKIEAATAIVREIIDAQDRTTFDRAHFKSFGESSLEFEVVYYMEEADFNLHMDTRHAINVEILRRFAKEGISMAFPTRTVHMVRNAGSSV